MSFLQYRHHLTSRDFKDVSRRNPLVTAILSRDYGGAVEAIFRIERSKLQQDIFRKQSPLGNGTYAPGIKPLNLSFMTIR